MKERAWLLVPFLAACSSAASDAPAAHPTSTAELAEHGEHADPIDDAPASGAFGSGASLRMDRTDKAPNLDGILGSEWPKDMTKLSAVVKGPADPKDASAQAALLYDDKNVYFGADVTDDVLRGGADHFDLVVATGATADTIGIYPGQPGKSAAKATRAGRPIAGAKVIEAPNANGWMIEAAIPWSAIGDGRTHVGMRGALFLQDADASDAIETTLGTTESSDVASLPPLLTTPEQALAEGLVRDKRLGAPTFSLVDDVAGGSEKERVLILDHYLVVLGPGFHGGTDYYFADMSTPDTTLTVLSCELKDVDGDGKKEIVLKKRYAEKDGVARDVLDIESFGNAETPTPLLRHEIGISNAAGSIANDVAFSSEGGKVAVRITPGTAKGLTRENLHEGRETSFDPVLLPWETDLQVYKLKGASYALASETKHAGGGDTSKAPSPPATTTPKDAEPKPAPKPDTEKVLATYRADRGASGSPKLDTTGDVAGDGTSERVVVYDKDIVVVGSAFKGGTGYAYTTLPFANASDIESVTLKDVTGDKKADIVVRGILRSTAPKEAGGGDVEREIEMVYRVSGESIKRVFAAEISRSIGAKKIVASLTYAGGKATLAPGKAIGFTEKDYPFNQDSGPVGGIEPLPLPWGGATSTTYAWDGTTFSR